MTVLELPTPDPRTFDDASRPFVEAMKARYAVKRIIGRGGMGIVYLARDRRIDRYVAIKTLPPQLAADESMRQRFLRYVDGDSLAAQIRAMGRLDPLGVARILRDVASALAHAHERGIIHRDIKAENILIEARTDRALVTDFGIARVVEAQPLTATGQMLGTVHYVSPEQIAGARIDARSDLYSLGVVGFLGLTGRFPFDDELASAVLVAHVNRPAPPVRSITATVPASLAAIVDRCLAKDPAHRYPSASAMLAALDAVIADAARAAPLVHESPDDQSPVLSLRVSNTEAQEVWDRAALLQASTESRLVPPAEPIVRDPELDRLRTSGHKVADVRDAGREAGISTRFMDRALAEHGLGRDALPARPSARSSWWIGTPIEAAEVETVPGELEPRDFDRIIGLLRDGTGSMGAMTASTREIGWRAEWFGHRLEASIVPADGVTTIRVRERMHGMAVATMTASVVFVGGVVGPAAAVIANAVLRAPMPRWLRHLPYVHRHDIPLIAAAVGLTAALVSIPIGRAIVRNFYRRHAARVRALTQSLVANVKLLCQRERGEGSPPGRQ
jgi:serine/threonine-protein kinase